MTPVSQVNQHLRDLAERVMACIGDINGIRSLVEEYAWVHPATRELEPGTQVTAVRAGDRPAEWVCAPGADSARRILYVHGGSWMSGSMDGYRALASRISAVSKMSVLTVDYRLTPEHPYPSGLDDCCNAWHWILAQGTDGESPATCTALVGDSAGGNLVLAMAQRLRDQKETPPNAVVALSPATDLAWTSPSFVSRAEQDPILRPDRLPLVVQAYLQGRGQVEDAYVSPLNGDLSGLPPTLLVTGEAEILLDDSIRYAEKARVAGSPVQLSLWPEMPHVFPVFAPFLKEATEAISEIGAFLNNPKPTE